jgi:hypothetical protein
MEKGKKYKDGCEFGMALGMFVYEEQLDPETVCTGMTIINSYLMYKNDFKLKEYLEFQAHYFKEAKHFFEKIEDEKKSDGDEVEDVLKIDDQKELEQAFYGLMGLLCAASGTKIEDVLGKLAKNEK